jgi:hypothetical protein
MGLLKNFKDMMDGAKDLTKQAQEYQQQAMKDQQAASQPVDLNDPMWAPIEGVTLDKYAEISAGLMKNTVMGIENVNKYAEALGVPEGAWQAVQNGWTARMGANMPVRTRFGNLYNEFLK